MRLRQPRRHRLKHTTSRKSRKWSLCDFVEKRARPQGTICRFRNVDFSERMSPARYVIARSLLRLLELGAMASSALASEAVCLNASRILAGRDRGDERQKHNDDPGHRCRLSVHENVGDLGKKRNGTQACREARSRPRRDFSRLAGFCLRRSPTVPSSLTPQSASRMCRTELTVEPPEHCIIQHFCSPPVS